MEKDARRETRKKQGNEKKRVKRFLEGRNVIVV